jgi:tetratricopeptide (TPR) repeat protein
MEWFDRHRVIRELRVFDEQVRGHSRTYLEDEIGRARDALFSGNQEEAFTIWSQMRRLFPTLSMTSKAGLALLLDLGAYDEADAMMRDGRRRYPGYADFAAGYAEVAHRRGDLEEALLRCGIVRQKFPDTAKGYTIAAACLAGLDRHQEAEAIIERAVLRLPHDYDVLVEHARHAMRRQDWQEALQRWRIMKNSFDLPIAPINMAECLRLMGSYAEAGVIATETCERYPGNHWALSGLANIAAAAATWNGQSNAGKPSAGVAHSLPWAIRRGPMRYAGLDGKSRPTRSSVKASLGSSRTLGHISNMLEAPRAAVTGRRLQTAGL